MGEYQGILYVVGIGPGAQDHATPAALAVSADAELIVGYTTYIRLVGPLIKGKDDPDRHDRGDRAGARRRRAGAGRVAGGAHLLWRRGVYGMAGLVFEVLRDMGWKRRDSPDLRIVPA